MRIYRQIGLHLFPPIHSKFPMRFLLEEICYNSSSFQIEIDSFYYKIFNFNLYYKIEDFSTIKIDNFDNFYLIKKLTI